LKYKAAMELGSGVKRSDELKKCRSRVRNIREKLKVYL
jgi:hypothetical protein